MIKKIGILLLVALLGMGLIMVTGCNQASSSGSSTTAYTPPTGVTSVDAGVSGLSRSGNTISFNYSLINAANNQPIAAIGDLGTGNLQITVKITSETSSQTGTVTGVTKVTGSSSAPISVAMTLDRSGSMSTTSNSSLETAASAFVDLMKTTDLGAIINFGVDIKIDQGLTGNKDLLKNAITQETVAYTGGTALFDSICTAVSTAAAGSNSRKAVIAMTDGGENASSNYTTTGEVIAFAGQHSVPVFTIGLGLDPISYPDDITNLQAIATGTGGIFFSAPAATDLVALYNSISSALSNYFTVTFTSPITLVTGTQYTITIDLVSYGGITKTVTLVYTAI